MSFFYKKMQNYKMWKHALILFVAFVGAVTLKGVLQKADERVLPPPGGMEHYAFGFNESMSDLLWLNFIQNSYECNLKKQCRQNWGYLTLKQAATLSPKFRSLYSLGATNLSILVDDDQGAKEIFDLGLEQFPNDWEINYRAGYHYLLEVDNPAKAADLFDKAAYNGAPLWTRSLSARLYSRMGQLEVSERILKDMLQYQMGDDWDKALSERLAEVQKKMAEQQKNATK